MQKFCETTKETLRVKTLTKGQVFGDVEILKDHKSHANLVCTKNDSFMYYISKQDYERFFLYETENKTAVRVHTFIKQKTDRKIIKNYEKTVVARAKSEL
jgi:hypothetical protein